MKIEENWSWNNASNENNENNKESEENLTEEELKKKKAFEKAKKKMKELLEKKYDSSKNIGEEIKKIGDPLGIREKEFPKEEDFKKIEKIVGRFSNEESEKDKKAEEE
jgi:hypothetical protein